MSVWRDFLARVSAAAGMVLASWRAIVALGSGVLVVLLLATAGWLWYGAQQRRALEAYAIAESRVRTAQTGATKPEQLAAGERELEATLTRFPSSSAAPLAAYQLAGLRYDAGSYGPARAAYGIALARGATGTLKTMAQAGIGSAWEAERNYAKAIEAYRGALSGLGPRDFYYGTLLVGLARSQELAGKKSEAIDTYKRLLKELPEGRRAAEVRARLMSLGAG